MGASSLSFSDSCFQKRALRGEDWRKVKECSVATVCVYVHVHMDERVCSRVDTNIHTQKPILCECGEMHILQPIVCTGGYIKLPNSIKAVFPYFIYSSFTA